MSDLHLAIGSPDDIAFRVYSAGIIDRDKREKINEYEHTSNKKRELLSAVESQILLRPSVYDEFVGILSEDLTMDSICRKMREYCGESQLCVSSFNDI